MTYEEFVEWLSWYFSRRDIEQLENLAYEESADAHEGQDITKEHLRELGRAFLIDLIRTDCCTDTLERFREDIRINLGIEMNEANAESLCTDIESGAF